MQLLHSELLHAPAAEPRVRGELVALCELGWPLALASLGQSLMAVITTCVAGRLGSDALGGVGLGSTIFYTIAVIGLGLMLGLDPIISQAVGAGHRSSAREVSAEGACLAVAVALPLALGTLLVGALLPALGIGESTAEPARTYLLARAPSLIFYLAIVPLRSYLGAVHASRSVLWAVLVSGLAMLVLAPALTLGGLGAAGAGLAESICTLIQVGILWRLVDRTGSSLRISWPNPRLALDALRIGLPLSLGLLAEFGVFSLVNLLIGRLDAGALAAHQVAITLAGTAFMLPVGVGGAASARVGAAIGRGDGERARLSGLVGISVGAGSMLVVAIGFLIFPGLLSSMLTTDVAVIEASVPLLSIAALFQISDGVQVVAAASLRGAGDTRFTLGANLLGHYAIGLPFGLILARGLGLGARGLWWGLALGISVVAVALTLRFIHLGRATGRAQ